MWSPGAHAGGVLRSGGLATAPKCILQICLRELGANMACSNACRPDMLQKSTAAEVQNPTSAKTPLRNRF